MSSPNKVMLRLGIDAANFARDRRGMGRVARTVIAAARASRNASRTIEGMVAALTICRAILVSGAMVETMSTTWNRACLRLKIPF